MLLRETDLGLKLLERLAACFTDHRDPELIEHGVLELLGQRVYGIALGYEDRNHHTDLMDDPLLALALGKADPDGKVRQLTGQTRASPSRRKAKHRAATAARIRPACAWTH